MIEQGSVISVEGNIAKVMTQRTTACESCGSKNICHSMGGDQKNNEVNAVNTANAQVGDTVNIEIKSSSVLKSAFLVYLVPLIFLFAGIIIGKYLSGFFSYDEETVSIVFGIILFVFSFAGIKLVSNRIAGKREFMPEVTKVIKQG